MGLLVPLGEGVAPAAAAAGSGGMPLLPLAGPILPAAEKKSGRQELLTSCS